jgi:hypothetical protein
MRRSTVSGNAFGVNVSAGATMWIYDSTITANASTGLVATGFVAVQNSIIANPTSGPNCSGTGILTGGYNLSSDATCRFTAATDLANTNADLGALAANGGLTTTHLPNAGSAAVDSGNPSCGPVDQRGVNRPQGAGCDRGAVER